MAAEALTSQEPEVVASRPCLHRRRQEAGLEVGLEEFLGCIVALQHRNFIEVADLR